LQRKPDGPSILIAFDLPYYNGNGLLNSMNEISAPIDKAGRVVLPKRVRDELAINPGDQLKISIHGGEVILRPTREASGFIKRGQALVFSSGEDELLTHETVETMIQGERFKTPSRLRRQPKPKQKSFTR
jgi:AbrB family looped-hinge helix DNA binding protein